MRFRDFLRVSVLIYAGAATVLAVVSVVGATRADTNTLVYVAAVWWCVAVLAGLWLGRRFETTEGIGRLLAEVLVRPHLAARRAEAAATAGPAADRARVGAAKGTQPPNDGIEERGCPGLGTYTVPYPGHSVCPHCRS